MYKISIEGEAEVFFPSFERAFGHLMQYFRRNKILPQEMRDSIESGNILSFDRERVHFEKVSVF